MAGDGVCQDAVPGTWPKCLLMSTFDVKVSRAAQSTHCKLVHKCRYAGGAQSRAAASGIKLLAKAKSSNPVTRLQATNRPTVSPEEEAGRLRAKQLEQQAAEKKAAEAAAKEKVAQRQWILQYAEDGSESDSAEDDKEEVCPRQRALQSQRCH